ncbi:MAG: hypothetical protein ABWY25_07520 [Paenisporosarcina sp.]
MHNIEFVWLLSGDDNRAADGVELRVEFLIQGDIPDDQNWRALGCSVLEMLIAFSRRTEFMTETPAQDWFWEFLDNLQLKEFNDGADFDLEEVERIVDQFIWRTYNRNGEGGLFPIKAPHGDQRHVEIWYQFCDYLADQERLP